MQVSGTTSLFPSSSLTGSPSASQVQSTDNAFAALLSGDEDAKSILGEITKDGITGMMKWKVKQLEKQLAQKEMQARNLTEEQIAAMDDKQRVAVENQIMKAVAEALKEAMNQQMQRQSKGEGMLGMFNGTGVQSVDIMA